ncbi:hypothetical protein Bbelb_266450 [Branchiostoma belcheri]|nr:hypothetical protein Bbelb_266450 [Branchiostoma belcheri]
MVAAVGWLRTSPRTEDQEPSSTLQKTEDQRGYQRYHWQTSRQESDGFREVEEKKRFKNKELRLVQAGGQTVALCSFLRCMRRMVRIAGFHGSLGPQPCHLRLQDNGLQINLNQGLLQRNNVHHRRYIRKGPGGHATRRINASSGPAGRILKGVGLVTSADESRRPRMN